MSELNWTGERLVTQITDQYGATEHLHRYALAMQIVHDKIVLDIASGEGYGSNLLSKNAKQVYGVDISEEAILHANSKYKSPNLKFMTGSTSAIPLANSSVDVVISFETIEHHDEHQQMMTEIKRVLRPDGLLFISSPEKDNYHHREKNNPFHIKELTINEFKALIEHNFKYFNIYSQRFIYGSIINKNTNGINTGNFEFFDGNYSSIQNKINEANPVYRDVVHNRPYFNIVLASNSELEKIHLSDHSFFNAIDLLHKQITDIRNSYSFRLGAAIVRPLSYLKSIFTKLS